jgi:hypothetical protein
MSPDSNQTQRDAQPKLGVDVPYTFGRPASTYLAPRQIVRLTILRSKLHETDCESISR